jgi:hypothetical protein
LRGENELKNVPFEMNIKRSQGRKRHGEEGQARCIVVKIGRIPRLAYYPDF